MKTLKQLKFIFTNLSFTAQAVLSSLLFLSLVIWKIFPYQWEPSSLIGIWEGFLFLNPDYIPKGFIVFRDGGYDGQFFFFNSIYIQRSDLLNPPILDSFTLRFYRIGLSLFGTIVNKIFGIQNYPISILTFLHILHITSSFYLKKLLTKTKYSSLYLLYLYSPFSWNSNLLLVSDSLLTSLFIILVYLFHKIGLPYLNLRSILVSKNSKKYISYLLTFCVANLFLLTKETALPIVLSLLLFSIYSQRIESVLLLTTSIFIYFLFRQLVSTQLQFLGGTNPMQLFDLTDWPLFGFFKSFGYIQWNFSGVSKEVTKLIIFGIYISLILQLKNIQTFSGLIQFIPIFFFILLISIAEVGYWLSFDNVSRFFTILVPYCILLTNTNQKYKFYGLNYLTLIIFILFIFRTLRSPTMNYFQVE